MSDLVYLGDPPPFIVIPPTTERAWRAIQAGGERGRPWHAPSEWTSNGYIEWGERTVPVSLDLDAECPNGDCEDGQVWYDWGGDEDAEPCSTCGGSGVVPTLWLAEQQQRYIASTRPTSWRAVTDMPTPLGTPSVETRLAVVARCTVQKLPVYSTVTEAENTPRVVRWADGTTAVFDADGFRSVATDEPWAQGLVPGAWVLKVGDRIELDTPIVEMVCDDVHEPDYEADPDDWSTCGESVPLSLVPGLNEAELAR